MSRRTWVVYCYDEYACLEHVHLRTHSRLHAYWRLLLDTVGIWSTRTHIRWED